MKNSFISLKPNWPEGFKNITPTKHDLLGGRVAIYADSFEDAISLLVNFTERVQGIVITRTERFSFTLKGSALWHMGVPEFMIADLAGIAASYLDMFAYGQSALNENEQLKLEFELSKKNQAELTKNYNENIQRLVNKVEQLHEKTEKSRQAEKAMAESKENLTVTLRSIGDGVITTDLDGKIVLINKVTEKLTGWTQQEAAGKPIQKVFNIVNEKTGEVCENPAKKVLDTGQIIELANHTTLIAKDGTQYLIEDSGAPIFNKENEVIGTVLVFRDVTEERKTKDELMKVQKLESVGVLAGGIAHDFNNILTAILGNIELAEIYTEETSKAYRLLGAAKKASIRAKDLTQQLLTFAKGGVPVKKTASISQIITDSANFVLHGSTAICDYQIPENLWQVEIDTGQISQVIQNIIINARDAMPDGGIIEVKCKNVPDISKENLLLPGKTYIKITFEDPGAGIPTKYIDKIFDPYFSTKHMGSGLGLSICHSVISKHDGNISVESKANKGTKFTIYLPASQEIASQVPTKSQLVEAEHKATIMIMDDEVMILDMTKQMLSRFGHEVILAANGHEAIKTYSEYCKNDCPIDLIIMDLTIPGGMGGKDAVQEILKINPDAKVIVASGYANDPVMAHCLKYGFKASIIKPFQLADLNKVINEVLG